ncbi:unnamed protein product [Somion occarium]|uniref:RRM domain-containing protein n=1 Tax=Somion occarium TaxID=3059160 RepID=A0ABP1D9A5_9APHY
MEEGTKTKKTVYVGGLNDEVDENVLLETFAVFGDVVDVQLPPATTHPTQQNEPVKHKGFGFVTFTSSADAQDAIDNMDLNELKGRVVRVNLARPMKMQLQGMANKPVWESEEWLKQYAKPLGRSGGAALRAKTREGPNGAVGDEDENAEDADKGEAMEE